MKVSSQQTPRWREVDSNPRSLSLDSREEKGRRSIRVVAKDAVPFHGGTVGSNLVPSTGESISRGSLAVILELSFFEAAYADRARYHPLARSLENRGFGFISESSITYSERAEPPAVDSAAPTPAGEEGAIGRRARA
jgi:hypothetical protein